MKTIFFRKGAVCPKLGIIDLDPIYGVFVLLLTDIF